MLHGNYGPDATRTAALARAAKMMKLFNKNCFKSIMEAVDIANATKQGFQDACKKVVPPLDQTEIDWLWSYLKVMTNPGNDSWVAVPDAAAAGW